METELRITDKLRRRLTELNIAFYEAPIREDGYNNHIVGWEVVVEDGNKVVGFSEPYLSQALEKALRYFIPLSILLGEPNEN